MPNQRNEQLDQNKNLQTNLATNKKTSSTLIHKSKLTSVATKNVRNEIEVPQTPTNQEDLSTIMHATMHSSQKKNIHNKQKCLNVLRIAFLKNINFVSMMIHDLNTYQKKVQFAK